MALTKVTNSMIQGAPVNVLDYGAVGDGVTDDTAAVLAALTASNNVFFPDGTYALQTSIGVPATNRRSVDFGNAILLCGIVGDSGSTGFQFGSAQDTPQWTGLTLTGGTFRNIDGTDAFDRAYITVGGYQDFLISDMRLEEVSNGGIEILSGCTDGVIEKIVIPSQSAFTTVRGIWLNGSGASDYASNLIDISTLKRNATPLPVYGVKNVTIRDCKVDFTGYCIYLMNSHNCAVINCDLNTNTSGLRNLSVNTYSPNCHITGNTFRSTAAAANTQLMLTEYSIGAVIQGNTFLGDAGLGRDIYCRWNVDALIEANYFHTSTTICIAVDSGASVHVHNNVFNDPSLTANDRIARLYSIEANLAGTSTYGDTATWNEGSEFTGNISNRGMGVQVTTQTSTAGRVPGWEHVIVKDNIFTGLGGGTEEYGMFIDGSSSAYDVVYIYESNLTSPRTSAYSARNTVEVSGATATNGAHNNMISNNEVFTFVAGDATPDISTSGGIMFLIPNHATPITNFDGGANGDIIHLKSQGNKTITHAAGVLELSGSVNYAMTTDDTLTLMKTEGYWSELSRMVL